MLITMARGAIPPTVALCIYQSNFFATEFQSFGYLVAVIAILSMCTQPRVPFIKGMFVTTILNVVGLCTALLAAYCSIQVRIHTTPSGQSVSVYNSSASAVSGMWLFFNIW